MVTTVNHFVNCPNCNFLPSFLLHRSSLEVRVQLFQLVLIISTHEIALANVPRDVLVLMSTLEIDLANILRDALVLLNMADVHQCNKVDFHYLLFFVCLLHDILSFLFHCRLCILFVLLGFPRHASLRDRSSESSEPNVTLDSLKFAEQNNIRSLLLSSQVLT